MKLFLDLAPLLAFFVGYKFGGIMLGTAIIIPVTLACLLAGYLLHRRLPFAPLVTALVVTVFGGLTLYLHNDIFIKLKPTIINSLFAVILGTGVLWFRVGLVKYVMGAAFQLTEEGWRILSLRWAFFFAAMAVLNEIVWRNFSESFWVNFKVFGLISLMVAFSFSQMGLVKRHMQEETPSS